MPDIQEPTYEPALESHSQAVLRCAGEAIWSVDRQGRTIAVNAAATQLIGSTADSLVGSVQHEVLRHADSNGIPFNRSDCPLCQAMEQGLGRSAANEFFSTAAGDSFPVEYTNSPVDEDGEIVGSVLTFRCIAARRLQQTKAVHAQKLESIGQLAAGIAHELNTPAQFVGDNTRFLKRSFDKITKLLAVCEGLVEAASKGNLNEALVGEAARVFQATDVPYLSEEIPKAIDQSLDGIQRVTKIVRAMKEFSHPEADRKAPSDLNRAIESTVTVARNEWKYVADMVLELDPALPLVNCLLGDINQVVLNLVVNAAHAIGDVVAKTATKGTIRVSTVFEGSQVIIRISDTGSGIPQAAQPRIFDPFFTTKAVGKGTGQGLAIAYSVIVGKHSGTISFETESGRGTTFIIHLPIDGSAPVAKPFK